MRRIAIGRLIGLLIALIGFGLSIWFAFDAMRRNAEFHAWPDARPMETAIDLSKPGEVTVPFNQTCSVAHGEALYLEVDSRELTDVNIGEFFLGISGTVVIRDSAGNEIETAVINGETAYYWDGQVALTEIAPFPRGNYVATICIDSGGPTLAGKRQIIYAKYQLCGLEQMPAVIAGVFAFVTGFVGLIAAVCVLPGLLYGGFREDSFKALAKAAAAKE